MAKLLSGIDLRKCLFTLQVTFFNLKSITHFSLYSKFALYFLGRISNSELLQNQNVNVKSQENSQLQKSNRRLEYAQIRRTKNVTRTELENG